eukprot:COSAG01_NODE_26_length_36857_cov_31.426166_16_plen_146_part_00
MLAQNQAMLAQREANERMLLARLEQQQQESTQVAAMLEMMLPKSGKTVAPPSAALLSEGNESATLARTGKAPLPEVQTTAPAKSPGTGIVTVFVTIGSDMMATRQADHADMDMLMSCCADMHADKLSTATIAMDTEVNFNFLHSC